MMVSVLITGANRGLGLGFVKQYAAEGCRVYACCRKPYEAEALQELCASYSDNVLIYPLDVLYRSSINKLASSLQGETIDILINNAGVNRGKGCGFGETDYDQWLEAFQVNTMASLKMAEAFIGHLVNSEKKCVVNISSLMGSITDNYGGGSYLYRSSKAALNAVTKSLSIDLKGRGVIVVALHSGWVKTDMGGSGASLTIEDSVKGMRHVIDQLTIRDSGSFLTYDGRRLPW